MEAPISVCLVHIKVAWRKIEPLSDGNVRIGGVQLIKLSVGVCLEIPLYSVGVLFNTAIRLTDIQTILPRTPDERISPESGNI